MPRRRPPPLAPPTFCGHRRSVCRTRLALPSCLPRTSRRRLSFRSRLPRRTRRLLLRLSLPLGGHAEKGLLDKASPISAVCTVGGSLSVVLGLFLVVAWAMRKAAPRSARVLPKEVFDILGRASFGARQQVQLLRCGGKLLLVSITPHGAETLTEVTDAVEVNRIAGVCQQGNPKSSTTAFRQVFQQLADDPRAASGSGKVAAADDLQLGGPRRKRAIAGRKNMREERELKTEKCKLKNANCRAVFVLLTLAMALATTLAHFPCPCRRRRRQADYARRAAAPQRRSGKVGQPRGPQRHDPGRAAADGAQPGPGHPPYDDLLRPRDRGLEHVAAGDGHAIAAAQPGHHLTGDVRDAGNYGAHLEAGLRAGNLALHEPPGRHGGRMVPRDGPIRQFISAQIQRTGNSEDVLLFWKYSSSGPAPAKYEDVPLTVLLPAYMLSELKTAFLIGFQIYLPFLILDMVIASVMVSMGMLMLPPTLVSLPFKILLFVLVDGWHLIVGMLMQSFQAVH